MIKDLQKYDNANGNYIVKALTRGLGSNEKPYLNITLQDKTGALEGKKWDVQPGDEDIFAVGNIVYVEADCLEYKDKLQLKIKSGSKLDENLVDVSDLIPVSKFSEEELIEKSRHFISQIRNPNIRKIVVEIIRIYKDKYIKYPAAVRNHHDTMRGLFEHSISMAEIAEFLAKHYQDLDSDYLIAGALLHDIGKCEELSGFVATKYTTKGDLLGHIVIGANIVNEVAKKLGIEGEESMILEHLILSHHGELEFGSPVLPMTKEAVLLSMIDNIDAKMKALEKAYEGIDEGEFTEKVFALGNRGFYNPKK